MTIAPRPPARSGPWSPTASPTVDLAADLALAAPARGRASSRSSPTGEPCPTPRPLRAQVADAGLPIHSAHGCWGGQSIRAPRVDLGDLDPRTAPRVGRRPEAVRRLARRRPAGPAWSSTPAASPTAEQADARRDALARGLIALADHARGTGVVVCVENMPPGVHPGSRMADLADARRRARPPRARPGARHRPRPHHRRPPPPRPSPPGACSGRPTSTTTTAARTPTSPRPRHDRLARLGSGASTRSTTAARSCSSASATSGSSRRRSTDD